MFQIAVDDAHSVQVAFQSRLGGHQSTVAPEHQVDVHSRLCRRIEFVHHVGFGDVVDFHLYPGLLSAFGILDFVVDVLQDACLHGVGRHHEFPEADRGEGACDEVEHLVHFRHDGRAGRHHQIVGIYLGVALVEVARADAGDVAFLRFDVEQFGVYFQAFHTIYHIDAFLLHALAPFDVALLVEAGQQFHHGRHLLAVACGADERLHHLGVFGQAVECGLDAFHLRLERRLAQQSDVAVERMVGHMYEEVFLPDLRQDAFFREKFAAHHVLP